MIDKPLTKEEIAALQDYLEIGDPLKDRYDEHELILRLVATVDTERFESLEGYLRRVPLTWLPALFKTILEECLRRKVFVKDGLETFVAKIKAEVRGK